MDLIGQGLEEHLPRLQTRGASVGGLTVDDDHALLATICIDAGMAEAQPWIEMGSHISQPIEHRLARSIRNFVTAERQSAAGLANANNQTCGGIHHATFEICAPLTGTLANVS